MIGFFFFFFLSYLSDLIGGSLLKLIVFGGLLLDSIVFGGLLGLFVTLFT